MAAVRGLGGGDAEVTSPVPRLLDDRRLPLLVPPVLGGGLVSCPSLPSPLSRKLGFRMAPPVGTLSQVPEDAKLTAWKVQIHGKTLTRTSIRLQSNATPFDEAIHEEAKKSCNIKRTAIARFGVRRLVGDGSERRQGRRQSVRQSAVFRVPQPRSVVHHHLIVQNASIQNEKNIRGETRASNEFSFYLSVAQLSKPPRFLGG